MAPCQSSDPLHQKYVLAGEIGHGSYGTVYQATCRLTGVAKAIKAVDPKTQKSGRDSFEIQVLQNCSHPNVITLEEVIENVSGLSLIHI